MQTRGPWEFSVFEEYPVRRGGYFIYSPGVKGCIAKLHTTGEFRDYDPDKSEAHDNARLIAAAPDLLEGCKAALSLVDHLSGAHPELRDEGLDEIHKTLRETISKATGITHLRAIRRANPLRE